jgi:16S rRNA (adenine1518-N6/adenine1519-N6)-dimethyltransferase
MNLTSPREVVAMLSAHNVRPNKVLGQNFLIDRNILDIIVATAELGPDVNVLEVGAGLGVLTEALMKAAGHVTSVEKDAGLYGILKERWGSDGRLTLVLGDALEVDLAEILAAGTTRLVSNLPYSVGVRVVVDAATCETPPDVMVVLLQKEVGERFAASPGTADMGAVTVWLQQRYDVTLVKSVKPSCFYPSPEVTSVVIKLKRHERYPLDGASRRKLMGLTKAAFLHRRKQMASIMRDAGAGLVRDAGFTRAALASLGASETARPEELSVAQWIELASRW